MGQRWVELTLRGNFYFQTSTEHCEEHFVFWDGREGEPTEGSGNQSTFEGVVTEWAKALRLPWTAAAGRHTETRDRRAHHHERESSCHRFFFCVFLRRQDIRRWMLYELVRFRAYNSPIVECIFAA